ncbi:MAG: DNA polymerase I, partial [Patescibacteria group bacterium]
MYEQIPLVKEVLQSFNITIFEKAGFEADDLIGTIAHLKSVDRPDIETIIVTGDQDALQLVDDNTKVLSPHKGLSETVLYDEKAVKEKFQGLAPSQLIDYKALRGDPSDNIPGVKGIGEKGAIDLLNEFKNLENIYENLDSKKIKERTKELLKASKDNAFLSKRLATIVLDAPIEFNLPDCAFRSFDKEKVAEIFQRLNFKRLLAQLSGLSGKVGVKGEQGDLFSRSERKSSAEYVLVDNKKGLKDFLKELGEQKEFCLDTETTNIDPFRAELLGISFSWRKHRAFYLTKEMVKEAEKGLKNIFLDSKVRKIGHNIKYDLAILKQSGFDVENVFFDTMIASYLLNPGHRQHNLDSLAFVELGYEMQPITDLIGEGKKQVSLAEVPVEKVSWYSCEDADITFQLYLKLLKELNDQNMFGLFEKLEMPLVEVLRQIETNGIKVDDKLLKKMSSEVGKKIKELETKIHKLAETKFNIASPLQLKEVLFGKMGISTAGIGKTKTGISTAAGELEKLRGEHKIIDLILAYRESAKLKNTYLDALPKLINPRDQRVHTSFNQTVTATGRLSSSEPNLQNIPVRTPTGQKIRQAFIAEKGNLILKADYSQIELRIVASLANDPKMLKIFKEGGDIHTQTAAYINEIKPEEVTKELRRQAKEVNFGVLYGMGAWGLASRTGISNQRAVEFIAK